MNSSVNGFKTVARETRKRAHASFRRGFRHLLYDFPLRKKLFIIALLVTLLPIAVLSTIQIRLVHGKIMQDQRDALRNEADNMRMLLEFYLARVTGISDNIAVNKSVQETLWRTCDTAIDYIERNSQLESILQPMIGESLSYALTGSDYRMIEPGSCFLSFYVEREDIAAANLETMFIDIQRIDAIRGQPWYQSLMTSSAPVWRSDYGKKSGTQTYRCFSVNRRLYRVRTLDVIGVVSVEVRMQSLGRLLERAQPSGALLLLDERGELLLQAGAPSPRLQAPDIANLLSDAASGGMVTISADGRHYMACAAELEPGWRILLLRDDGDMRQLLRRNILTTAFVAAGCLLGSLLIMLTLTRSITGRLRALTRRMQNIGQQLVEPTTAVEGKDEFSMLDMHFNRMTNTIGELIGQHTLHQRQLGRVKAELIQQQVNPHLLYNSLSAIRFLAVEENVGEIGAITTLLMRFYRTALSRGDLFVRVEDELAITRDYISLITRVYQVDVDVQFEGEEEVRALWCLKLILQPLAENALMHGLRDTGRPAMLRISLARQAGALRMQVYDNGHGIPRARLDDILRQPTTSFGLHSVDRRIKLYYGDAYGLTIESEEGAFTRVSVLVPEEHASPEAQFESL